MSWLNLNESLNNIKGQISSFASGVLADGIVDDADPFTELSAANKKIQELQNLCASQDVEITSLRRQNAEFFEKISHAPKTKHENEASNKTESDENWFWDPPTESTNNAAQRKNSTNSTISDLNKKVVNLELEKKDLVQSLEQLDLDCQRTTDKLVTLKDNLQSDYNKLKSNYETVKKENSNLINENTKIKSVNKSSNTDVVNDDTFKKLYDELQIKFDLLSEEKKTLQHNYEHNQQLLNKSQADYDKMKSDHERLINEKYKKILNDYENMQNMYSELDVKYKSGQDKIQKLNNEIEELKLNDTSTHQSNLSDDHKKLQDMYNELENKCKEIANEKEEMHKKYVNILTETVKKYVNYEMPEDFIQKSNETLEISEFNSKVESVLKLLLDFKWKTETLERKLCEISHEKTVAITEKNHEIEKLLHNSEILSQEVITKTQTIKHYEMECSELIKNNDLLIAELQQYKNNNGLQTISESNEDNLLLLEQQLENANKRIRELELAINDMENAKQDVALETQTELDYIKKQLNMTGKELSQSKKEYQELLKMYKQYETELTNTKLSYDLSKNEQQNLENLLEKMKSEMENTEYKFTEANVDLEAIREELQNAQKQAVNISNTNLQLNSYQKEYENKIELLETEITSLKSQIESTENIRNQMEHQLRSLTEKLQSSKMAETGLKLQNDTIKKEMDLLLEHNICLEQKLQKYDQEITNSISHLKSYNNSTITDKLDFLKTHLNNLDQKLEEKEQNHIVTEDITLLNEKTELEERLKTLSADLNEKNIKNEALTSQIDQLNLLVNEKLATIAQLESEFNNLNASKNELVNLITVKHQENIQYHSEIQRLNQVIAVNSEKQETSPEILAEIEKLTDQNNFLKEKCEKLAQNLLEEQSNSQKIIAERHTISEKEQSLTKELERLRLHLVEIEDSYTRELLHAEQKNQEMLAKVNEIEQRERDSSTIYTSVSIRANQQVETLQNQLQLVTTQRDELQKKISEAEDKNNKQFAALTNLQCVLEQFQKDREKDIVNETERIRRQIAVEQQKQNELQGEISTLKAQLEESKQGLKAAARLTEQIEKSKQQVVTMKDEVTKLQDQLSKTEVKHKALLNQTDAKVDKMLIKNLIVGFISSNNNLNKDQAQIVKIISTVLDFNQHDNEKLNLNKSHGGSWLSAILHPATMSNAADSLSQQSLSEAFVRFLENESQPKPTPPPLINVRKMSTESNASNASSTTRQLVSLNEVVLPTFADFAQNRNSSSILKDVLKEN